MEKFPNHILLISKPYGLTSFKLTDTVRRLLGAKKAGHTGTLDPMGTGLMVIVLNRATRFIKFLDTDTKEYVIQVLFGMETDTGDTSGNVVAKSNKVPKISEVESAIEKLTGEIEQTAPAFSAKKINGTPFYELARKGKSVPQRKVKVVISEIEILGYEENRLNLRVLCSKGTYMRSLATDLGRLCGSFATLSALARTKVGRFSVSEATVLSRLMKGETKGILHIKDALSLPELILPDGKGFSNGADTAIKFAKVFDKTGKFLGVGNLNGCKVRPERVLNEDI